MAFQPVSGDFGRDARHEDDPYDEDLDHLPTVNWSTWAADSCSVVKAFIGANYLGVSYAFHLCGVFIAMPLFLVIAFASRQGCRLLIECKMELDRRDAESLLDGQSSAPASASLSTDSAELQPTINSEVDSSDTTSVVSSLVSESESASANEHDGSGFATVGARLFGPRMADMVKAMLVLTQFGYCVGYLIFLAQTLQDLGWLSGKWSTREVLVPLFAAPLAMLALPADISRLVCRFHILGLIVDL
jgi:amino acid permease